MHNSWSFWLDHIFSCLDIYANVEQFAWYFLRPSKVYLLNLFTLLLKVGLIGFYSLKPPFCFACLYYSTSICIDSFAIICLNHCEFVKYLTFDTIDSFFIVVCLYCSISIMIYSRYFLNSLAISFIDDWFSYIEWSWSIGYFLYSLKQHTISFLNLCVFLFLDHISLLLVQPNQPIVVMIAKYLFS